MDFHVLTEHRCSAVTFHTYFTSEWLVDAMHGHMLSQLTIYVECATANITFERLIAGVNFFVRIQCALATEFLAANITLKRFLPRMGANVSPAVINIRKRFLEINVASAISKLSNEKCK